MDNRTEQNLQNQKNLTQCTTSQFLRRVTKLLLSVSVFSLFFSHSTWLSFLHSFNCHFSTLPLKLFSHTLDKNFAFLLCNGLLVFLAKYSGFFRSSSSSSSKYNLTDESYKIYEDDSRSQMIVMGTGEPFLDKKVEVLENNEQARQEEETRDFVEEEDGETKELVEEDDGDVKERENGILMEDDQEEIEEPASDILMEEVDEKEEEEENGMLSTEELNKKFDDFIRKMKEELRIEAQQQRLIMV